MMNSKLVWLLIGVVIGAYVVPMVFGVAKQKSQ